MRDLIIKRISNQSDFDYCYKRGDSNARAFVSYQLWLKSLSDEDLLDTLIRVEESYNAYCKSE